MRAAGPRGARCQADEVTAAPAACGDAGNGFFFFFFPKGLFPWGRGGEGGAWDAWPRSEQLVPVPPAPIPTRHY